MISFYADENVDRRITNGLRRRGVDVLTAQEANLIGRIPDEQQLQFATDHGRALLTGDTDLLGIAHAWGAAGRGHGGVVFFHPGWTSIGQIPGRVGRPSTG